MARVFANTDFGYSPRNLTFNGTKFNFNGVQGKAVYSSLSNLNQDKLESFSKIVKKNLNLNNQSEIKTSSNLSKNYEFNNEVSFKDKVSGNTINLRLTDENLAKLKTYFGSQNFDKDKNGQITLKGEAENFVSGWFGDIAYKRNYVGADTDKKGFLKDSEKGDTLAGYSTLNSYKTDEKNGSNVALVQIEGVSSYLPYSRHYDAPLQNTIEKALNATLKADTNMDGYLNLGELQSKEEIIKYAKKTIEGETPSQTNDGEVDLLEEQMKRLKKWLEEQLKKQLEAGDYASSDEYFNALEKEFENIQSISISFKISEELVIKNLDNANFTKDLNALINEIKKQAKDSLTLDISA